MKPFPPAHLAGGVMEFFVNYGCNAKCPFCFNPPDATPELEKGLAFDDLAKRMYLGRQQGLRAIKFIGGEVTIRPDLPKMLGLAKKLGYESIQITTNGIRLADADYCRLLVREGADSFRFSIHGERPEVHDPLVAVPGAFDKCLKAIENLRPLGVSVGINHVISRPNYTLLPEFLEYFYALGIHDIIVYFLRLQGFAEIPANTELLKLRMSEAAPYVQEAYRRLKAKGYDPLPALIHMPPCAVPGLEGVLLDWTVDPAGSGQGAQAVDTMTLPDGSGGPIHEVTNAGKRRVAACRDCVHGSKCLGVEEKYLAVFGEAEFRPLATAGGRPA